MLVISIIAVVASFIALIVWMMWFFIGAVFTLAQWMPPTELLFGGLIGFGVGIFLLILSIVLKVVRNRRWRREEEAAKSGLVLPALEVGNKPKRMQPFSVFALLFSVVAICVAVLPNHIYGMPAFLGDYTYLGGFLTADSIAALIENFNFSALIDTSSVYGLGATLTTVGLLFSVVTALLALIGLFAKRRLVRPLFAAIAFVATLGILCLQIVIGGFDSLGELAAGYYIHVGAALAALVFSL